MPKDNQQTVDSQLHQNRRKRLCLLEEFIPDMQQELHDMISEPRDDVTPDVAIKEALYDWSRRYFLENWMVKYFLVDKGWATPDMQEWMEELGISTELDSQTQEDNQSVATFVPNEITFDFRSVSIKGARQRALLEFDRQWETFIASLPQEAILQRKRGRPRTISDLHLRCFIRFQNAQHRCEVIAEDEGIDVRTVQRAVRKVAAAFQICLRTEGVSGITVRSQPPKKRSPKPMSYNNRRKKRRA